MGAPHQRTDTATTPADGLDAVRHRDAGKTRQLLLSAARRRFARDGYAATTVRDIATDAGVNVALINRYFSSKEGLFATCLADAADELEHPDPEPPTLDDLIRTLVEQIVDTDDGERSLQLLLLLRTSGDEQAERIRCRVLASITQRMAAVVGGPDDQELLLRTQIALSAALGLILLRLGGLMQPLATATVDDLIGPFGDAVRTLMRSAERTAERH